MSGSVIRSLDELAKATDGKTFEIFDGEDWVTGNPTRLKCTGFKEAIRGVENGHFRWAPELDQRDYIQVLESAVDEALDVIDQLVEFGGILSDENDESIAKIKEVRKK